MGLGEVIIPSQCFARSDDRRLSPCVEKQLVAPAGRWTVVLLDGTKSKTPFSHLKGCTPKQIFVTLVGGTDILTTRCNICHVCSDENMYMKQILS